MLFTIKWNYTEGADVTFNCPKCGTQRATAKTQGTEEKISLAFIPLFTGIFTTLACRTCGKSFKIDKTLEEVLKLDVRSISENIENNIPFLIKFCVVGGIAAGILPFLGFILALVGFCATFKRRSGWRIAARIGLVLSLLSTAAMIIGLAMGV